MVMNDPSGSGTRTSPLDLEQTRHTTHNVPQANDTGVRRGGDGAEKNVSTAEDEEHAWCVVSVLFKSCIS